MKTNKIFNYRECARRILQPGSGRDYKVWIKRLTGVDRNKRNGFAFEGEFLVVRSCLTENELSTEFCYLIYGEYDSGNSVSPYACLATFDGHGFLPSGPVVIGCDYALRLRDEAEKLITATSGFCPNQFIASLAPNQIYALRQHLIESYG